MHPCCWKCARTTRTASTSRSPPPSRRSPAPTEYTSRRSTRLGSVVSPPLHATGTGRSCAEDASCSSSAPVPSQPVPFRASAVVPACGWPHDLRCAGTPPYVGFHRKGGSCTLHRSVGTAAYPRLARPVPRCAAADIPSPSTLPLARIGASRAVPLRH